MSIVTKARVKATGEIIRVSRSTGIVTEDGQHLYNWYEVETLDSFDEHYWTRLEHQYAGMAMQGILSNPYIADEIDKEGIVTKPLFIAEMAKAYAHALVEKLKKEKEHDTF